MLCFLLSWGWCRWRVSPALFMNGTITTVDGLFMSLIMLALSGILFLNVYLEARKKFTLKKAPQAQKTSYVATQTATLPAHMPSTHWRHAACIYALVAGTGPLLPPACSRGGRDCFAAAVLGGNRLRLWQFISFGRRRRTTALPGLLLSGRADHDRAVHFDLHHDVGDRRSQRRISVVGAGRPGTAGRDRAGQGSGWNHALGSSGFGLSGFCSPGRDASWNSPTSCWSCLRCFWFHSR